MALERFGPFFALLTRAGPAGRSWRTLAEVTAPDALAERVELARAAIFSPGPVGTTPADTRAVASTMALTLFARLLSPVIGAALTGEPSYRPDPATILLDASSTGLLRTSAPLVPPDPDRVLTDLVRPLASAVSAQFLVSQQVLLGNMAAAVVGACDVVVLVEPALSDDAHALRRRMLTDALLLGTGTAIGPFVRASCCLIYRLPGGGLCSNCVLVAHRTKLARSAATRRE